MYSSEATIELLIGDGRPIRMKSRSVSAPPIQLSAWETGRCDDQVYKLDNGGIHPKITLKHSVVSAEDKKGNEARAVSVESAGAPIPTESSSDEESNTSWVRTLLSSTLSCHS